MTHTVRIIGGQWKRTPLPVLDAEGLRPTPDRVRETVFNWITHLIDGAWEQVACLDLFAGSGALGFEAASRGARRVVMVENSGPAVRQLEANRDKLKRSVRICWWPGHSTGKFAGSTWYADAFARDVAVRVLAERAAATIG